MDEIIAMAEETGFSHVGSVQPENLIPMEQVRQMCRDNRCGNYGRSWSCPPSPACGTLEEMRRRILSYQEGILVQTTGQMADSFDTETIRSTEQRHKRQFDALVRRMGQKGSDFLALGSGACRRCHSCTYPDRPCRYPRMLYPSMEACGLFVADVCRRASLPYNYGENTITYTACILIRQKEHGDDTC